MRVKRRKLWCAALAFLLLTGCGAKDGPAPQPEPPAYYEPRPAQSMEQQITPAYLYEDEETDPDPNHVFTGWVSGESVSETAETAEGPTEGTQQISQEVPPEKTEEQAAQYQDVSQVDNAFAIPALYGWAGETVTATVQLCGQVELCAADMTVQYDKRYLKWAGTAEEDDDVIVHCDEETGTIYINLLRMRNAQEVLPLCQLQFTVLTTEPITTVLDAQVKEAVSLGAESAIDFCPYSIIDGTVYLNRTGG